MSRKSDRRRSIHEEIDPGLPQLTMDGNEVPTEVANEKSQGGRGGHLSYAQREILRVIHQKGSIRAVEAGVIVHAHRKTGRCYSKPPSATTDRYKGGGSGCCAFAATDGSSALKRLRERGLVRKLSSGRYGATSG